MARRAMEIFLQAERLGGVAAKAQLASLARITSTEAATVADTEDVIVRLTTALEKVREARSQISVPLRGEGEVVRPTDTSREAGALRKHVRTFLELMSQRSLFIGDMERTVRRIDEAASAALDIERVSVWLLDGERTKIRCIDLFERRPIKHSSGVELLRKDFAPYFDALQAERTIAAHDAHTDPRTACFSASYLKPLGINSMLDVPIHVGGSMVGVICHEHVGPARRWNSDEETFAYLLSTIVALGMERSKPISV